jgi:DnaJ family protein C protein 7
VVEANAVLSDSQRRERYDLGEDEDGMNDGGMGGMGGFGGMNPMDMEDIFAQLGGGRRFGGSPFGGGGSRRHSHGFPF